MIIVYVKFSEINVWCHIFSHANVENSIKKVVATTLGNF